MDSKCHHERNAHHSEEFKQKLINRMNRVEGQVKGIRKMIAEDKYCDDVLTQISAVRSALSAVAESLLEAHLNSCIIQQIQSGSEGIMEELQATIHRMLKN
ncbi:MAG: CsoR family transcriptional regulator [Candidatus Cloacimonetes bacterium HGW-Cloacimonetes-3]|jgi:DNA-binding FrmR family transcriptional regulator|nr:MAG: CsoR family transcriptional regulator [Candidatus Cloacimonetes bacterium HGW-Cloacimonetes-3]